MTRGRPRQMTDDEIIDAIQQHPDRAVTAVELAEGFDMTSAGILKRLNQLHEQGELRKKRVGGGAVVWWVIED